MDDYNIWKTPGTIYRRDTYPYIDPSRPALSTKGKTAIVTGAGSGIGAAIAQSLARSGISALGLLGRTEATLQRTRAAVAALSPATAVHVYAVDVLDADAVAAALAAFEAAAGAVDVLVASAGYMADPAPVAAADAADWWRGFEVNVRGSFHVLRAFARGRAAAAGAVVVHVSTAAIYGPYLPGHSSYRGSKIGAHKVFEMFGREMTDQGRDVRTVQIHPGLVWTDLTVKIGKSLGVPAEDIAFDSVELSGDFVNWVVSDEAKFLHGRFVAANWDAEELIQMKEKIEGDERLFTLNMVGC